MPEINKARQYKRTTVRRLDTLSGNQCAKPDCINSLVANDQISIISKICHIEAASKKGARYNSNMTDDQRRHYDNLILLCDACHTIIDNKENEEKYPVNLLRDWKSKHEKKELSKKEAYTELKRHPASITFVINCIGEADFLNTEDDTGKAELFIISNKITHNNIIDYKPIINEYKDYQGKLQSLYTTLEAEGSLKRSFLLKNIRTIYLQVKEKYITNNTGSELDNIRKNADRILDDVKNKLWTIIENSNNLKEDTPYEAINIGLLIVMVDAFIECKILEKPPN